jgi:hypothetical protein
MTISVLQVQNILKIYHRNTRGNERRAEKTERPFDGRERVEISAEGRRRQIRQNAADQMIERLTRAEGATISFSKETR